MPATDYIRWFRELSMSDLPLVGGKNASLGELFQQLTPVRSFTAPPFLPARPETVISQR